jgi:DNA-binding GntR family transcriptional regulator
MPFAQSTGAQSIGAQSIGVVAPPPSRTDFVLQTIKEAILAGELAPGQPLVESELAARFAVSKTPVREALKTLAGTGLVVMSTYKGASVAVLDRELLRSVYEVRALLEPAALRLAITSGDRFDAAAEALAAASAVGEIPPGPAGQAGRVRMSLANRRFHQALYAGCGNRLMVEMLDGLKDRATERAAELLRRHIQKFDERVLARLPGQAVGPLGPVTGTATPEEDPNP